MISDLMRLFQDSVYHLEVGHNQSYAGLHFGQTLLIYTECDPRLKECLFVYLFIFSATRLLHKTEHPGCVKNPQQVIYWQPRCSCSFLTRSLCSGCSGLICREQQAHRDVQLVGWKKLLDFLEKMQSDIVVAEANQENGPLAAGN